MSAENEKFAENNKKLSANVDRLEGEVDKMAEVCDFLGNPFLDTES